MKRLIATVLGLLMLLCGCQTAPTETTEAPPQSSVPADTRPPATESTAEPTTAPTEDPADSIRVGYYILSGYVSEDFAVEGIAAASFRGYLQILPDRTGILSLNGVIDHVEWSQRYLTIDGSTCKFTIEDDEMVLNYFYQADMTFSYCGEELPDYYRNAALEPGLYLLTDLIIEGESYYVEDPGMTEGYILLEADHTGTYSNGEESWPMTWRNDAIVIISSPQTYTFYTADQMEDGIATLVLYDLHYGYDLMVFRAVDPNAADDF